MTLGIYFVIRVHNQNDTANKFHQGTNRVQLDQTNVENYLILIVYPFRRRHLYITPHLLIR